MQKAYLFGSPPKLDPTEAPKRLQVFDETIIFINELHVISLGKLPPLVEAFGRRPLVPFLVLCNRGLEGFALASQLGSVPLLGLFHESHDWMLAWRLDDPSCPRQQFLADLWYRAEKYRSACPVAIPPPCVETELHKDKSNA